MTAGLACHSNSSISLVWQLTCHSNSSISLVWQLPCHSNRSISLNLVWQLPCHNVSNSSIFDSVLLTYPIHWTTFIEETKMGTGHSKQRRKEPFKLVLSLDLPVVWDHVDWYQMSRIPWNQTSLDQRNEQIEVGRQNSLSEKIFIVRLRQKLEGRKQN